MGVVISCSLFTAQAVDYPQANTEEEITSAIEYCLTVKNTAHQLAECARSLGYAEDSETIKSAQTIWWEAHNKTKEYETRLEELKAKPTFPATTWTGSKLTRSRGVNYGPQGKETYYNLPMNGVVNIMRRQGFDATNYPYWVRQDGCKMLGPYIMVAANLNVFPRGSVVECSLGWALVCDTGGFARHNPYQLDIAVNW